MKDPHGFFSVPVHGNAFILCPFLLLWTFLHGCLVYTAVCVRACACAGRAHSGAGPRRASSPLTGSRWEPPSIQAVQSLACPQRLLFAACHSDSARSRVSARARTLGTVGQPPRRDAKRPQRRVNTAASAVSAAVRRQK